MESFNKIIKSLNNVIKPGYLESKRFFFQNKIDVVW